MKEAYPASKGRGRKQPPTPIIRPFDENCFEGTLADWEQRVFRNASHFTVVRYGVATGSERTTVDTFPQALAVAGYNSRVLVYAVTDSGRAFCVPRSEWFKYYEIWLQLKEVL